MNHPGLMKDFFCIISGNYPDIKNEKDLSFTRLDPIISTNVIAKLDFYDGDLPQQIDEQIRKGLAPWIIPTENPSAAVAPHFFLGSPLPKEI